jgi:hypothetical protein
MECIPKAGIVEACLLYLLRKERREELQSLAKGAGPKISLYLKIVPYPSRE